MKNLVPEKAISFFQKVTLWKVLLQPLLCHLLQPLQPQVAKEVTVEATEDEKTKQSIENTLGHQDYEAEASGLHITVMRTSRSQTPHLDEETNISLYLPVCETGQMSGGTGHLPGRPETEISQHLPVSETEKRPMKGKPEQTWK